MKEDKKKLDDACIICENVKVKTDGYYHSFRPDTQLTICIDCYEGGIEWAARQARKSKP